MLLKKGDNNEQVKQLQVKLHLDPVGNFGPKTEEAVKLWQSAHNLTADGIVGDKTWAMIMGEEEHPQIQQQVAAVASSTGLKLQNLKGHIPDSVIAMIPAVAEKFQIDSALRLAHFLAQCALESGNFKWVVEFASGKAYEGRKDLGNTEVGDGVKFKGRGYIQLTGRSNYTKFSKFCNEDCVTNPDLVATKFPMLSAAYFFDSGKLWSVCDKGSDDEIVKAVTKRVNGGYNGLSERTENFHKFWNLLK